MAAKSAKSKTWRKCAGVNSRTGRIKPGYRPAKGGCPQKAAAKGKGGKKAISYSTGGGYAAGIEAWKAKRVAAGLPAMPQFSGLGRVKGRYGAAARRWKKR